MPTTTETSTSERAVEVTELRRAVLTLREELERRDVEQMELEGAAEFLLAEHRTHLYVIGELVRRVIGENNGGALLDMLYAGRHPKAGFRQARFVNWRRPDRRWRQFGSRKDLLDLADRHGVKVSRKDPREWILRALWECRELRDVIPGAVGPYK